MEEHAKEHFANHDKEHKHDESKEHFRQNLSPFLELKEERFSSNARKQYFF